MFVCIALIAKRMPSDRRGYLYFDRILLYSGAFRQWLCRKKDRIRKGGRVVECAGLEIQCWGLPNREFESHPFRHVIKHLAVKISPLSGAFFCPKINAAGRNLPSVTEFSLSPPAGSSESSGSIAV